MDQDSKAVLRRYISQRINVSGTGCWEWSRSTGSHGYPQGSVSKVTGKRVSLAHRLSYMAHIGDIPEKMQVDHTCKNRICVNPDHLEAVPQHVNIRRQFGFCDDISVCAHGHSGHMARNKRGELFCRECTRVSNKRYRLANPEKRAASVKRYNDKRRARK